jgi:hypothetical protein
MCRLISTKLRSTGNFVDGHEGKLYAMKRVTKFEICLCDPSQLQPSSPYRSGGQRYFFESWHKTCGFILDQLLPLSEHGDSRQASELQALAFDARSHGLIAHFCRDNFENSKGLDSSLDPRKSSFNENDEGSSMVSKSWDSVIFAHGSGGDYFENRNVRDYYWELLEGAQREVPFRLHYLERQAESNLLVAHSLSFIQLFREALRLPI